jgi:hypothetical protein
MIVPKNAKNKRYWCDSGCTTRAVQYPGHRHVDGVCQRNDYVCLNCGLKYGGVVGVRAVLPQHRYERMQFKHKEKP